MIANGNNNWKKCQTTEEYHGQTTNLRPSIPWKALNCFSMQSIGRHEALLTFIVQSDIKSLEQLTKLKETIFDIFRQSIHAQSWLAIHIWIKTHCYTYCLICSSTHSICFTFRRTERAKPYMKLIFFEKPFFPQKFSAKILWKKNRRVG